MKLHVGCGKIYKEGFINIDAYDSTVADKIMPANDLSFSSNSIDEIESIQLIEHLGFFNAIYALSEWFRVLKPGGYLLIETPNLEVSFKKFINGGLETKKNIITWVYGVESKGMLHKLCFPEDLLEELLKKIGFIEIEKTYIEIEKDHPTIRLKCKKNQEYEFFQVIADFRKKLLNEKIVVTNHFYVAIEQEKLVDFFISKTPDFFKNKNYEVFNEIIIESAIISVEMTLIFIEVCINHKLVSKSKIKNNIETLKFLSGIKFISILEHLVKESPDIAGTQNKVFQMICNIGKQSVKKLLTDKKERSNIKASLMKLSKEYNNGKTVIFARDLLERKASVYFYRGVKEFILGNYNKAIAEIKKAIKLDRNRLLYYWNLGRIFSLNWNFSESKSSYENAIKLVKISKYKRKKKLEESLRNEMNSFSSKEHYKPVTEILD